MKRKLRNPPKGSIILLCEFRITTRDGASSDGQKLYLYDKKRYTFWYKSDYCDWLRRARQRSLKTLEANWHKDAAAFGGYITKLDIEFTEIGEL